MMRRAADLAAIDDEILVSAPTRMPSETTELGR